MIRARERLTTLLQQLVHAWADAPLTPTERRRSLIAVIACISVVGMGLGVSIPLLALLMERSGVPASLIGLNTAMPALATFVFTPFIPGLLRRVPAIVGGARLFAHPRCQPRRSRF